MTTDRAWQRAPSPVSWGLYVLLDRESGYPYVTNAVRLATELDAQQYALDLRRRWTSVLDVKILPFSDAPTHHWGDSGLRPVAQAYYDFNVRGTDVRSTDDDRLMTIDEAMRYIGCGRSTIYSWQSRYGEPRWTMHGTRRRLRKGDIDAFLAGHLSRTSRARA